MKKPRLSPLKPVAVTAMALAAAMTGIQAQDPANPESQPVEDQRDVANRNSHEVDDTTERANRETTEVRDTDPNAAPDSEPVEDRSDEAAPDSQPVEDREDEANPGARRQRDSDSTAGRDARRVRDSNPDEAAPDSRRTEDSDPMASPNAEPVEDAPDVRPEPPLPENDGAPESETTVQEASREVEERLDRTKQSIDDPKAAHEVIEEVLGAESRISAAEMAREERTLRAAKDAPVSETERQRRREAVDFLRNRLQGSAPEDTAAPEFFRTTERDPLSGAAGDEGQLRYFHEGRRFATFDSRAAVPAILFAAAALDRVNVQPASEMDAPVFTENTVPEAYRGDDAWVVSYPVSRESMVTSNDILFMQGSTQFADDHSFAMLEVLEGALSGGGLADAHFVIEGHASAEGSYEENLALSQRRAEAITRQLVRSGVDPERLIPVGFGESEARYPENAAERLRQLDRRVVVFRMDE